ncbi:phospholipase [Gracilibacillus sp. JCM 18860]|uniref:phospholipase n=1 Tax=Gracilibacillus sp. JCM 18860 TaxID=1306159 RepID=UPI0006CF384D
MFSERKSKPRLCIPKGYNWCGPGCSGPGAPINEVDAACKRHDECYQRNPNRCACDKAFLHQIRSMVNHRTEKGGRHAHLLYRYMQLQTFFRCGMGKDRQS